MNSASKLPNQYTYNKFGSRNSNPLKTSRREALEPVKGAISKSYSANTPTTMGKLDALDYANNYIHTGKSPVEYIRNINNPIEGYPKLTRLHNLKKEQVKKHAVQPYGARVPTNKIVPTLNKWINEYGLKFDVIMIGALVENQFILPILLNLPIHQLCAKPGFLFIWATTHKIQELTKVLNNDNFNKKFRRSEELIFLPLNKDSPYYPGDDTSSLFEKQQWHCWMCITGTVRRSTDNHLIHCNVDTDLQIESPQSPRRNDAVPDSLYKIAENFSNSNRRLHIIPSRIGYNLVPRMRPGWVIMGPDLLVDNFDPVHYEEELYGKSLVKYSQNNGKTITQFLVQQTDEIEELRPKSPVSNVSNS
ncbi:uncharacterized protein CANTADRAFT_4200 [Suhomyces tanzawaensis NRRL Y-17324]|uniref:Karyogamy protein KAR4 n=1 Tax=Suhomyces tanzawaensis NRRL Y-17324 TaxID=984487 RepID=A0A1E4SRZ7_9ASCO|nr:uncharacterized protein CANTADRAFT_4200 [Suhomyces tanzawaensis NRRL Y-17324]ODV82172.1 hypothetical protein CANTADRAFT_4200 [Suhomyces tanzawaensis NRRL Y-17324]